MLYANAASERLLLSILPPSIVERLQQGEMVIADRYDEMSVLFADVVDFTRLSASLAPSELVEQLNRPFGAFDALADRHRLRKIKTIGDACMVVGGPPVEVDAWPHAHRVRGRDSLDVYGLHPMYTVPVRRLQIYIDEPLDDMLAVQAHRQHRSKAALIREAVAGYFGESAGSPDADPLDEWIGGTLEGDPGDIDEVVYGSAREPASPPSSPTLRS